MPVSGVTVSRHLALQAHRGGANALADDIRKTGLVAVLTHPVFEMGVRLDKPKIEKRALPFGLWVLANCSRPPSQNALTGRIAADVDASTLRHLAAVHGLTVPPHRRIAATGGSDDRGGSYGAAIHTIVPKVKTPADLLEALPAAPPGNPCP